MSTHLDERESAISASEQTCPRCGTPREPDQRYCLECGLALPNMAGAVPGLRRRWLRRVGWYPGDWVWISLLTLLVAAAGATAAILITHKGTSGAQGQTFVETSTPITVQEPTAVPTTSPATGDTSTLPTAPEPTTTTKTTPKPHSRPNGHLVWPANENGWTIVLVSYPKSNGHPAATSTAAKAAQAHLRQVGILDSSRYASLQPGYYVVFSGVYATKSDADASVGTARGAGFGGAYSRQIAR